MRRMWSEEQHGRMEGGPVDQGRAGGVPRRGLYWFQLRALAADAQTCVMLFITTTSTRPIFCIKKSAQAPPIGGLVGCGRAGESHDFY